MANTTGSRYNAQHLITETAPQPIADKPLNTQVHQSDLDDIVQRGRLGGVERLMLTGSCLKESKAALKIAQSYRKLFPKITMDR
jgi:Tat protein secretion system quality control protein TatD with DNase activity